MKFHEIAWGVVACALLAFASVHYDKLVKLLDPAKQELLVQCYPMKGGKHQ